MAKLVVGIVILCGFAYILPNFFRLFRSQIGMTICQYHTMFQRRPDSPPLSIFSMPWDVLWTKSLTEEGLKTRDEYFRHMFDSWEAWRRCLGAFLLMLALIFIMDAAGLLPDAKTRPSVRRDRSRDSILFPIANEIEDMRNSR